MGGKEERGFGGVGGEEDKECWWGGSRIRKGVLVGLEGNKRGDGEG